MRKIILPLLVIGVALLVVFKFFKKDEPAKPKPPKEQPLSVSRYSDSFKLAVTTVLDKYYTLSETLVNWDSGGARSQAFELSTLLNKMDLNEIRKDTLIYETAISYRSGFKSDLDAVASASTSLEEKRRSFHSFSQNLFDLLRTIKFDAAKVYLQECPMAFNDTESAIWLSNKPEIRNPYLGLHHPTYKSGMLACGDTKDSLRFGLNPAKTN